MKAWAVIKEEISNVRYAITEYEGVLYYTTLYKSDERNGDDYQQTNCFHKVCNAKNLLLFRIRTDDINDAIFAISWEDNQVFLNELTVKSMMKAMEKAGVIFTIPRRKKSDVMNALREWLLNNAQYEYMPKYIGWNKNKDGKWHWANTEAHVLERMNL